MADINLLRTENSVVDQGFGMLANIVAKLLMLALVLALLGYAALYIFGALNDRKLTSLRADIQTAQAEALANKDRNELLTRQQQLQNLETLVDNHLYWSYLLPEMARVTLKSAKYTNMVVESDGRLEITATLPSYEDVEKFMQIFDLPEYNQQFSNVQISGIGSVQGDGALQTELRLKLKFNPEYIKGRL